MTGPREAVEVCHLFCHAFASVRTLIAVATRKQAINLHRALEGRLGERVGLAVSGVRRRGPRLLVATFGSVPRDTAGRWDILLLPYGQESTGRGAIDMVTRMDCPRIYACVTPGPPADRLVRLRLEQIAGPVIGALDSSGAAVSVVVVPTTGGAVANARTALERKRELYWHNRARNQTVADVARAVVTKDWKALRRYGVQKRIVPKTTAGRTPRVAVLVESTEHGRELTGAAAGLVVVHDDADGRRREDRHENGRGRRDENGRCREGRGEARRDAGGRRREDRSEARRDGNGRREGRHERGQGRRDVNGQGHQVEHGEATQDVAARTQGEGDDQDEQEEDRRCSAGRNQHDRDQHEVRREVAGRHRLDGDEHGHGHEHGRRHGAV